MIRTFRGEQAAIMFCERAMANVTEINRLEDLQDVRATWNALVSQTPGASFFHTCDWLQTYWKHFGADQRLRVLLVTSRDTPIGILPLTEITERTRLGRLRVLTYPLHDWGTYFGPIGPNPTATLTLGMRHLNGTDRNWDLLDMRWVNRDGHDHLRTQWAMEQAGFRVRESVWKTTAIIDMDGGWNEYWLSRTAKLRHNVGRDDQRIHELGDVEHVRYRPEGAASGDDDPRWDLYDACVDIARASWQGKSTTGTTLSHGSVEQYFRDAHAQAARLGMLDLNLLTVNKRPVAFSYNYACQGKLIGVRRGHLREVAKHGVGNVLFVKMLRDSFQRGDRSLDLGTGTLNAKNRWCSRITESYRYTHYPLLAPRVQMLRLKHVAMPSRQTDNGKSTHA